MWYALDPCGSVSARCDATDDEPAEYFCVKHSRTSLPGLDGIEAAICKREALNAKDAEMQRHGCALLRSNVLLIKN